MKLSLVDGVAVDILAEAKTVGQTGVEMEALTGAVHAASCPRFAARSSTSIHPATPPPPASARTAGAAVAGLTVIDMVKAVTKEAKIEHVQIEYKSGGKSGEFQRSGAWGV